MQPEPIPDTTPAEVVAACDLLIPLCQGLIARCPEVWSAEAVEMLTLFRDLARGGLQ